MKKKICSKCKIEKDLSEFNRNKARSDGYNTFCRECAKKHSKDYYKKNKEKMIGQINERKNLRIIEVQRKIYEYKSTHSCVDCGEADPIVLQFDHQSDKEFAISSYRWLGYSWNKIKKEIDKCEVRCANCHIRRTSKQFDWYKDIVGAVGFEPTMEN